MGTSALKILLWVFTTCWSSTFSVTFTLSEYSLRLSVNQDSSSSPCPVQKALKQAHRCFQILSVFFLLTIIGKRRLNITVNGSPRIMKRSLKALLTVIPGHHLDVSGTQATVFELNIPTFLDVPLGEQYLLVIGGWTRDLWASWNS